MQPEIFKSRPTTTLQTLAAGTVTGLFLAATGYWLYRICLVDMNYLPGRVVVWFYVCAILTYAAGSCFLLLGGWLQSPAAQKKYLRVTGVLAGFFLAEILLRLAGIGITTREQTEGIFMNPVHLIEKTYYRAGTPYGKIELITDEFTYARNFNSEGFSDTDWNPLPDSNEIRIMTLGDSFTEGFGCAAGEAYPSVLRSLLQKKFANTRITVMNAGKCGSDPWLAYQIFKQRLLPYQPHIVVYTNSSNDLFFDHLLFGGMQRSPADTTAKINLPAHAWLGWYGASYTFRLLANFWYDNTLVSLPARLKDKQQALADSRWLSGQFSQLAVAHGFTCIQLVRPDNVEIEDGEYNFDYTQLTGQTHGLPAYSNFNMLQYYRDSLHMNETNVSHYFWQNDFHHNARGYAAMAQAVAAAVQPLVQQKIKTLK